MAKQARSTNGAHAPEAGSPTGDDSRPTAILGGGRFKASRSASAERFLGSPAESHAALPGSRAASPAAAKPTIGASSVVPGAILEGRYRIERVIGEGGMATVYLARHVHIDAPVAIKVLAASVARIDGALERFLLEARAASAIHHPNVVVVSDYGVLPTGLPFIVMEYLPGDDLETCRLREGPMPWSRVRRFALQLCDALQAAHDAGVIHRDVKPHNCVLQRETSLGEFVKVLDFGIAKVSRPLGPRGETSGDDVVVGTPSYMAPEQAQQLAVDHRADIYSLGVVLFVLLTGELPFPASDPYEEMRLHVKARPPVPSSLQPGIDPRIDALLLRAMAKDREQRFSSMRELAAAIEAIGAVPVEISVVQAVPSPRAIGRSRSRARWIGLAGIGVVIAAVSVVVVDDHAWLRRVQRVPTIAPVAVGAIEPMAARWPGTSVSLPIPVSTPAVVARKSSASTKKTTARKSERERSPKHRRSRAARVLEADPPPQPTDDARPTDAAPTSASPDGVTLAAGLETSPSVEASPPVVASPEPDASDATAPAPIDGPKSETPPAPDPGASDDTSVPERREPALPDIFLPLGRRP